MHLGIFDKVADLVHSIATIVSGCFLPVTIPNPSDKERHQGVTA